MFPSSAGNKNVNMGEGPGHAKQYQPPNPPPHTHARSLARSCGIELASSRASPSLPPVGGGAACGSRDSDICPVSRGKGGTGWLSLSLSLSVQARGLPPCLLRRCGVCQGRARLGRLPRRAGPAERRGRRRPRSKGGRGTKFPPEPEPDRTGPERSGTAPVHVTRFFHIRAAGRGRNC